MAIEFTAHNIRLDNGVTTKPELKQTMDADPRFVSARRVLETVFPGDKKRFRLADLGCLEGGYAVEFARMGFQVLGLEVRESNIAACEYVKANTNLPHLQFVQDDAWNIGKYGVFDAVFCCGLLYHLDQPKRFLQLLSANATRLLILQTHFSTHVSNEARLEAAWLPDRVNHVLSKFVVIKDPVTEEFNLSEMAENEGLPGRWYREFATDEAFQRRESFKWAAWDNRRSFWVQREYLLDTLQKVGFDVVLEQFESLGPEIAEAMTRGYYKINGRGTFVGIKTGV